MQTMKHNTPKKINPYAVPGLKENEGIGSQDMCELITRIKRAVCKELHLDINILNTNLNWKPNKDTGKRKRMQETLAFAMYLSIFIIVKQSKITLAEIGKIFGNRDHSSMVYACKVINDQCDIYSETRRQVNTILFALGYKQLHKDKGTWDFK